MTRDAYNVCYRQGEWQLYKDRLREYKKAVRTAKSKNWHEYCEAIENTRDSARLSKILSKEHSNPSFLKRDDGTWTHSAAETLQLLVEAHFPGSIESDEVVTNAGDQTNVESLEGWLNALITKERITWAIDSFSPYKAAGPDGIFPKMLQESKELSIPWITNLFKGSLLLGHNPQAWRKVKVVFIPKAGKRGHVLAKDFRPISLSSYLLKTLERILEMELRNKIVTKPLCKSQHAYCKGRSTETALSEVVGNIEKSLEYKQYTLATFLDIEGAFNNITNSAILEALTDLGVETTLCQWIANMLNSREIQADLANCQTTRRVSRGTPQGGVLSPLLWLLVMDKILKKLQELGITAVAYADDLAILVSGKYIHIISEIMGRALNNVSRWAKGCGLCANPAKTELMLFTTRTKIPVFECPILDGVRLHLTSKVKYLGVILDPKLNWKSNVDDRARKAYVALYSCKKMLGKRWGLKPRMALWMYTAIVRPILTYGSTVWWPALKKQYNRTKLGRVQRGASMCITGALRTTPRDALDAILYLLPPDLHIQYLATCSAVRLREMGHWLTKPYGHSRILGTVDRELIPTFTDYTIPKFELYKKFKVKIPTRKEWKEGNILRETDSVLYTDGSKMDCGVGAGVFSESNNISKKYRLPDTSSVFQAEVLAIWKACKLSREDNSSRRSITVATDSQAAILALNSASISSKLVLKCEKELALLSSEIDVTLLWVPGHRNIHGNEMADELARGGASMDIAQAEQVDPPLNTTKRNLYNHFLSLANERWRSITTCRTTTRTWPTYDKNKSNNLLLLSRKDIARATAIYTGHWPVGEHAARLGIPYNQSCRSCKDPSEKETVVHYLCNCPALARARHQSLGSYSLTELSDLSAKQPTDIVRFLNATKWI